MALKYIIYRHINEDVPVIFPSNIVHEHLMVHSTLEGRSWPVSAGFCHVEGDEGFRCYGESTSLKLKSREEDAAILNESFRYDI